MVGAITLSAIGLVLVIASAGALLWRRNFSPADPFNRYQRYGTFAAAAFVVGMILLAATLPIVGMYWGVD